MKKNAMFEERKANVSETAKKIVDSYFNKIDLEESAKQYSDTCADRDDEIWWIAHHAFIKGANHMRNSVWHAAKETPLPKCILVEKKMSFDTVIIESNLWQKYVENYGVKRYAYIEDLIPMED